MIEEAIENCDVQCEEPTCGCCQPMSDVDYGTYMKQQEVEAGMVLADLGITVRLGHYSLTITLEKAVELRDLLNKSLTQVGK